MIYILHFERYLEYLLYLHEYVHVVFAAKEKIKKIIYFIRGLKTIEVILCGNARHPTQTTYIYFIGRKKNLP